MNRRTDLDEYELKYYKEQENIGEVNEKPTTKKEDRSLFSMALSVIDKIKSKRHKEEREKQIKKMEKIQNKNTKTKKK